MKAKKIVVSVIVLVVLMMQMNGCSQQKSSVNEIAQLDRNNMKVMVIKQGNSVMKEFEDKEMITNLLNHLESIKFSKMSIKQEQEVFGKGEVFNKNTTYVIQLTESTWNTPKAEMILISDKQLYLVDSETIVAKRTVLYMNQSDDLSLNETEAIYALAKAAID